MPHNGNDDQDNLASSDEIKVFKDEGEEGPSASAETSADLKDLKSSLITEGETNFHPSRREPSKLSPMVGGPHPTTSPLSFMMHHREFLQPPPAHMGIHYDPKAGIRPPVYPLSGQYSHAVFPEFTQQLQWHTPYPTMTASSAFRGSYLPNLSGVPSSGFTNFSPPSLIPPHPGLAAHHHPGLPQLGGTNQKHQDFAALVALNALNSNHHHHHHHHRHQHHESLTNGLNTWGCLTSYPHSLGLGSACGDQKPNLNHLSGGLGSSSSSNGVGGGGGSSSGSGSSNAGGAIRSPSSANHPMSSPTTPDYNSKHASGQNNHATSSNNNNGNKSSNNSLKHVKKPLNAFMLYMKDKRSQVVAECTLKESAAINQILGKRWHSLPREEQAKYYDMARKERQLHLQLYPGWTAKDNYAVNQKKKKKKRDKSSDGEGGSLKKCRARYGLDNQNRWCKPCRRKKKCTKFLENGDGMNESELDNINSVESLEPPTPDSRSANETDSENMNMSSAELSLSSPPVPNSDYHMVPQLNSSNSSSGGSGGNRLSQHQPMSHSDLTPRSLSSSSSSTLNSLSHSCPPRNSPKCPNNPLSVEQLTRPHHPPMRPSMPHSSMNNHNNTHCISVSTPTSRSDPISIPQLPTPPSTDSSSASGPQMLTVA